MTSYVMTDSAVAQCAGGAELPMLVFHVNRCSPQHWPQQG
jgi:hypothetical protein